MPIRTAVNNPVIVSNDTNLTSFGLSSAHQLTTEEKKRLKNRRKKMNRKIRKRNEEPQVINLDSPLSEEDKSNLEESDEESEPKQRKMTKIESEFSKSLDFGKLHPNNIGANRAVFAAPKGAALELFEFNIFKEYDALKRLVGVDEARGKIKDAYKIARMKIFEYILNCVKDDPIEGDYYNEENIQLLKDAGKMLYDSKGMKGMYDEMLWSFIPDRYRRPIDMAWDGIGEWQG